MLVNFAMQLHDSVEKCIFCTSGILFYKKQETAGAKYELRCTIVHVISLLRVSKKCTNFGGL